MTDAPEAEQRKQAVRRIFNTVADGYDNPATRFFLFCADRLVSFVQPPPGTRVLDVATGTGAVAVPFAQAIGPQGRVHAVDLSAAMLARAEANANKMALANIDLHEMDAAQLDFKTNYFHSVVCSFGLFFIPDMEAALREWVRVLRPGGKLAFTSFEATAFEPMLGHFAETLRAFGVALPEGDFGTRRIKSLQHCRQLLTAAGLEGVETELVQVGYHLQDEQDWWEVLQNTATRGLLDQVPVEQQAEFRRRHLAFVAQLKTDDGIWMDVQARFASGLKPA